MTSHVLLLLQTQQADLIGILRHFMMKKRFFFFILGGHIDLLSLCLLLALLILAEVIFSVLLLSFTLNDHPRVSH